jgi:hypothetical protein
MQLDLTTKEQETLIEILESYMLDLRMEIADTKRMDFREELKTKEQMLKKILDSVHESIEVHPTSDRTNQTEEEDSDDIQSDSEKQFRRIFPQQKK